MRDGIQQWTGCIFVALWIGSGKRKRRKNKNEGRHSAMDRLHFCRAVDRKQKEKKKEAQEWGTAFSNGQAAFLSRCG
jgi:hypothetical protein